MTRIWTIGFFLLPAVICFLAAGYLAERHHGQPVSGLVGVFLVAAVVQAAVILLLSLVF